MDVERGSGNVFADLGLPNAEEYQVKADIAMVITKAIRDRGITQVEAGKILGDAKPLAQPKVSDLMRGKLGRFTVDRLLRYMKKLDHNVTIMIEPKAANQQQAAMNVQAGGIPLRSRGKAAMVAV